MSPSLNTLSGKIYLLLINTMLTFFGLKVSIETVIFFVLFLSSEVVGQSQLKSNGLVQLLSNAVSALKPLRKEDDKIEQLKKILRG